MSGDLQVFLDVVESAAAAVSERAKKKPRSKRNRFFKRRKRPGHRVTPTQLATCGPNRQNRGSLRDNRWRRLGTELNASRNLGIAGQSVRGGRRGKVENRLRVIVILDLRFIFKKRRRRSLARI